MKNCKPGLQARQEECGVWLDTAELKGKAKQKRFARPISKMLNPFAGGGGYNVAVALNFTQTKLEMPKTKQSSLSAFFMPQRRVVNKMSTAEEAGADPVLPSSSSPSTSVTPVASGIKRRHESNLHCSDPEPDVDPKLETGPDTTMCQEQTASHATPQNMHSEYEEEERIHSPQKKRRLTGDFSWPEDSQPLPQAWSQDPLFSYSEYYPSTQNDTTAKSSSVSEAAFSESLQSEEAFGLFIDVEARTSTQKSFKHFHSSQLDDEKENSRWLSPKSPNKHSTLMAPLSNKKTASPRKCVSVQRPWKKADKEESSDTQFIWAKPSCSPLKKSAALRPCTEVDEDSLAMLFTQDSEGFRVIAHRGLQARGPLKDQSNIISTETARMSTNKPLVEDEDVEMLFTQDSQGNLVIKH